MADPSWSKHMADALRRNGIRLFATGRLSLFRPSTFRAHPTPAGGQSPAGVFI